MLWAFDCMTKTHPTPLLFITWLGAAVRWRGVFANTFHTDEALFASWARLIAVWRDPLLKTVAVDKPPLLFYAQALFYPVQGPVEWAARLPNFAASIWLIPLTAVLAHQLTADRRASYTAALLVALSPLAIQFSPTAFTDPLMTTLVVAGLVAAVGQRPRWAGLWLGLAMATKYQAVLFVPLAWGLGGTGTGAQGGKRHQPIPHYLLFTIYFLLPILLTLAWDYGRTGHISLWQAQMSSYGGVRLAWSWELRPRLWAWAQLGWFVLGGGWLLLIGYWLVARRYLPTRLSPFLPLFLLVYMLIHWLLAVPVWDRYLLPLVPLTAVWVGALAGKVVAHVRPTFQRWLVALALLLLVAALPARLGRWSIGGQPTADAGAQNIATYLLDAPDGTVLYDHWYSWQWRYLLFDTAVYVSWFPHPANLVDELTVFGTTGRYVVLPTDGRATPIIRTLHQAHFALHPVATSGEMALYQLAMSNEQ